LHYDEWLRSGSRPFVEETIARSELYEDVLNVDAVRAVVANHMAGKVNNYSKVALLFTFALWRAGAAEVAA
jgi:hypothetical protein